MPVDSLPAYVRRVGWTSLLVAELEILARALIITGFGYGLFQLLNGGPLIDFAGLQFVALVAAGVTLLANLVFIVGAISDSHRFSQAETIVKLTEGKQE